jgi:hypothetical protein
LDTASPFQLGGRLRTTHAGCVRIAVLLAFLTACGAMSGSQRAATPTTGGISGLARDHDSGDPVASAEVRIFAEGHAPMLTSSSDRGEYKLEHLPPGIYSLTASFAGQPVDVRNIVVRAGSMTNVDIVFTLGRPDPIRIDNGDQKGSQIDRYRPKNLTSSVAIIEGTVNDSGTRLRVVGAVVTAVAADTKTQQTVSDDNGRFRFDAIPPGIYSVSAYYSVGGRGQIEVRRSGITVDGAEAVVVPLWIEMAR